MTFGQKICEVLLRGEFFGNDNEYSNINTNGIKKATIIVASGKRDKDSPKTLFQ